MTLIAFKISIQSYTENEGTKKLFNENNGKTTEVNYSMQIFRLYCKLSIFPSELADANDL